MRIAVGLSGGVDSSVAAAKLVAAGHDVVGVTMLIWPDSKCCGDMAILDAAATAHDLGIPYHTFDLMNEFKAEVVDPFLADYAGGRTPNPCPTCNERLKFNHMWRVARELAGVTHLGTGHYARVRHDPETGRYQLLRGVDLRKDQSYMLFRLDQEQLSRLVTPLGDQTKEQTREDARRFGLHLSEKPDSQDLCFTSDDLAGFLAARLPDRERPGPILDRSGRELGEHRGTIHYTVGQRKGLGIAAPQPLFVLEVLPDANALVVGTRDETTVREFPVDDVRWTSIGVPSEPELRAEVKVRHGPKTVSATVIPVGADRARVVLDHPLAGGASPGQFAVFHAGDVVLGGGTIGR
ncbi:MAG: tRNA 2-thiouridine(34) synthase MnmA [Candidatus Sericytochromatia bacterium]|nr:tRNA 2-thiouridine(34) synthase MnmA [Candidatus Tanganyikabacteria bacterium]